jgi:hypothetical protein
VVAMARCWLALRLPASACSACTQPHTARTASSQSSGAPPEGEGQSGAHVTGLLLRTRSPIQPTPTRSPASLPASSCSLPPLPPPPHPPHTHTHTQTCHPAPPTCLAAASRSLPALPLAQGAVTPAACCSVDPAACDKRMTCTHAWLRDDHGVDPGNLCARDASRSSLTPAPLLLPSRLPPARTHPPCALPGRLHKPQTPLPSPPAGRLPDRDLHRSCQPSLGPSGSLSSLLSARPRQGVDEGWSWENRAQARGGQVWASKPRGSKQRWVISGGCQAADCLHHPKPYTLILVIACITFCRLLLRRQRTHLPAAPWRMPPLPAWSGRG